MLWNQDVRTFSRMPFFLFVPFVLLQGKHGNNDHDNDPNHPSTSNGACRACSDIGRGCGRRTVGCVASRSRRGARVGQRDGLDARHGHRRCGVACRRRQASVTCAARREAGNGGLEEFVGASFAHLGLDGRRWHGVLGIGRLGRTVQHKGHLGYSRQKETYNSDGNQLVCCGREAEGADVTRNIGH